jgi:hypothetical protein
MGFVSFEQWGLRRPCGSADKPHLIGGLITQVKVLFIFLEK